MLQSRNRINKIVYSSKIFLCNFLTKEDNNGKRYAQKDADMLFEKTAKEGKKELEKASEKANLECDILSRTADKNRKRVIDGAIQRLSL